VTPITSTGDRELGRRDACGVMPTRTPATLAEYRRDYGGLFRRSGAPTDADDYSRLLSLIGWFAGNNGAWAPATIRKYRAAIQTAIADWASAGVDVDEARTALLQHALDSAHPAPRSKSAAPRTSARKRLTISAKEREDLVSHLAKNTTATCRLLAGLVTFEPIFGLRPREWLSAQITGDVLVVTCAKHTNRRGVAAEREIVLTNLSDDQRRGLARFIAAFHTAAAKCGIWQVLHDRLSKSLTRACQELGMPPICLYTMRHQAIATAKRHMPPIEVAALFGHASPATAPRHYARRRAGWKVDPGIRATPSIVALVRRPSWTDNLPSAIDEDRLSRPAP